MDPKPKLLHGRHHRRHAELLRIKTAFPYFDFEASPKGWMYKNFPTVRGRHPKIRDLIAHLDGKLVLEIDNPKLPRRKSPIPYLVDRAESPPEAPYR